MWLEPGLFDSALLATGSVSITEISRSGQVTFINIITGLDSKDLIKGFSNYAHAKKKKKMHVFYVLTCSTKLIIELLSENK